MKLKRIAEKCDYEIANGNGEEEIFGIAYADLAKEGQMAVAFHKKDILHTDASVALAMPTVILTDKTLVYSSEPLECALVRIAKCLIEEGVYQDYTRIPEYAYNGRYYHANHIKVGEGSVIGQNAVIGADVTIGNNCRIEPNAQIKDGTEIGDGVHIGAGSVIGADSFYQYYDWELKTFCGIGRVKVKDGVSIGANTVVQRGALLDTEIGAYSQIGDLVNIGHDVKIGKSCKIVSQTGIASRVTVGNRVVIYGQAGIANDVKVGDDVVIMAQSLVSKDIPDRKIVSGVYARDHAEELRIQAKIRRL